MKQIYDTAKYLDLDYTTSNKKGVTTCLEIADLNHNMDLCSSFQETTMDLDVSKQETYFGNNELECLDLLNWFESEQKSQPTLPMTVEEERLNSTVDQSEPLALVPETFSDTLAKLQSKQMNLILLATPMDQEEVIKKLQATLDPKTSQMIPLCGKEIKNLHTVNGTGEGDSDLLSQCSSTTDCSNDGEYSIDENNNSIDENNTKISGTTKSYQKRKQRGVKDDKYWKRRNSNNEAAKRSREAKRQRFIWIEKRSCELEIENRELEERLEELRLKAVNLQTTKGT